MRLRLRRWLPAIVVLAVGAAGLGALTLYRMHLGRELRALGEETARLRALLEDAASRPAPGFTPRCPPVVELDPGWVPAGAWGPGGAVAIPLLDGGGAEVRLAAPGTDPAAGPALAWNAEFRVYEVAAERIPDPRGFHVAVRLPDGGWARTVPSNWPWPLCAPWLDCSRDGCEEECLPRGDSPRPSDPPAAVLPEPCRPSSS